jgi:hypothetical protein
MAAVRDVPGPGVKAPSSSAPGPKRGPAKGRPGPDKAPKAPKEQKTVPYREGVVKKGLTKFYTLIAMMLMLVDQDVAKVVLNNAEAMAASWEILARQNPRIRRILYGLISTTGWGLVVGAHVPIFVVVFYKRGSEGVRNLMGSIILMTDGDILRAQDPGEAAFNLADLMAEETNGDQAPAPGPAPDIPTPQQAANDFYGSDVIDLAPLVV